MAHRVWLFLVLAGVVRLGARVVLGECHDPGSVVVPHLVDVNRASVAELATLPGIGRTRARALVLHRVRHGPFRALDDLAAVDGVGPTTVAELAPFLRPFSPR